MPTPHDLRRGLIACVLLCTALSSVALTLGRARGVALIGRPLDMAVAITLDNASQVADLCAEADVFHADTRVDAGRVTARIEPAGGLNAVLRVRSSMPVDEPVVTVYLRLGCGQKITRRYVLLSEEPGEYVPPVVTSAPAAIAAPGTAAAAAAAAPVSPAATSAGTGSTRSAAESRGSRRSRRAAEAAQASRAAAASESAAPAPARSPGGGVGRAERALGSAQPRAQADSRASRRGRSRLTVDMLDLVPERDPQLRSTAGMTSTPATSEQVRAQAAALWRSINAQPEDVLHDIQRVQALENDVKGLRALVAGNDRTLGDLRQQLNAARQERTLTLAAIALLTLLLAAMVVTWWLRRGEAAGSRDWWRRRDPALAGAAADSIIAPVSPAPAPIPPMRASEMDLRVDESMFESLKAAPRGPQAAPRMTPPPPVAVPSVRGPAANPAVAPVAAASSQSAPPSTFHSSFSSSQVASMRMVKAEELVDVQQQADFFMSLGQTDQAIEVLESHIHNNAETSALVWLDLLAIYRALKRREDYELLRADFQRTFNAEVPGYDSTPTVSGGLEDYPRALSRIAALWPSPKVMDVIEESIFRKPGTAEAEPFDLEAYRELVMLYNLGREVVQVDEPVEDWSNTDAPKSSFFETSMQPLSQTRSVQQPARQEDREEDDDEVPDSDAGHFRDLGAIPEQPFEDSMLDDERGPHTTIDEFIDPQVPRPSPRLGLDIDLSTPVEPRQSKPSGDANSIDFELSEPGDLGRGIKPGKH